MPAEPVPSKPVSSHPPSSEAGKRRIVSFLGPISHGVRHITFSQWILFGCGLLVLVLSNPLVWGNQRIALWTPAAGLGLVLTAWLGWLGVVAAALSVIGVHLIAGGSSTPILPWYAESGLLALQLAATWRLYHHLGKGSRTIDDPTSATAFLLVAAGAAPAAFAAVKAWFAFGAGLGSTFVGSGYWQTVIFFWISDALGILALCPLLLASATSYLTRAGWIATDAAEKTAWRDSNGWLEWGDLIEILGLSAGGVVLGVLVAQGQAPREAVNWHLWASLLLIVVWASLRQGLRGGALVAGGAAVAALVSGGGAPETFAELVSLQGNLLTFCILALLVGASSEWLQASELRYRQVVGHIPAVLYSARFRKRSQRDEHPPGHILLISAACRDILGCPPHELLGDYTLWLRHVHEQDRELLIAAVNQLARQRMPVRCEYRLNPEFVRTTAGAPDERNFAASLSQSVSESPSDIPAERWVRDTLAPHYDAKGNLLGWEGVIEDITTQKQLAQQAQRASTMLHALVANLPAGVFFVQGPTGHPVLVNARARQLLGQREDLSAGIPHLPRIYRLHRPDGTLYPWEELPVYKALHLGLTTMRDDIVIHRADGRQVPLITWASPIELSPGLHSPGKGGDHGQDWETTPSVQVDRAAVWVFEDLTALQQAEVARLESESRLRTIIETMAEGLLVQDHNGVIIECNPAACSILGVSEQELLGRAFLASEAGCIGEDGRPLPRDSHPDVICLQTREPVRNVVVGIPLTHSDGDLRESPTGSEPPPSHDAPERVRWIVVNCLPFSTGQPGRSGIVFRILTTFADISAFRRLRPALDYGEEDQTVSAGVTSRVGRDRGSDLVRAFVHENNNLLTAISTLAHMLQLKIKPDHSFIADLEAIQASAEEAVRLTNQLEEDMARGSLSAEPLSAANEQVTPEDENIQNQPPGPNEKVYVDRPVTDE